MTGLVTVPTATTWSTFGKIVILGLVQFGSWHHGVPDDGVLILRRKISLQSRKLIQDTYNLPVLKGSVGIVRKLLIGTAAVELAGAFFYSFWFVPEYGFWKGIVQPVPLVSAFCNAGIDLVGESSFAPFVTNLSSTLRRGPDFLKRPWLSGLVGSSGARAGSCKGKRTRKNFVRGFTLHTKLVLTTTVILLFGGGASDPRAGLEQRILAWQLKTGAEGYGGFFQSVTTRTAGFLDDPAANFSDGSAMVSMILMFIGGSPMGTAGGVKTTTVAILLVVVASYIRGDSDTVVWGRKVMEENIRTAVVIFFFALTMAFTATVLLISVTGSPAGLPV